MESRCFEVLVDVRDDVCRFGGQWRRAVCDQAVHVVHPEPYALEVERPDRARERVALIEEAHEVIA